jgi:N-acetylmuramoyl-L-alanine amidase
MNFPILRVLVLAWLCCIGFAGASNFRTVIIDPGHGGRDKGGQWGLVYEKHLALDTSVRLENHLRRMGYRTVMTRRSDYFITLPQRVAIANRHRDAIMVSVHYNYTWKQDVSGIETFYHSDQSRRLAQFVQQGMLRRTRAVDRGAKFARYYVIRHSNIPSILVEGGFVSNRQEREKLKTGWYREAVARGIAEGIERYRRGG